MRNPLVVSALLDEEIKCCRIAGPFNTIPFPNAFISPLGLIPKKVAGLFRLIHDLSFPKGNSVNDGIPQNLRTVHYESFDDAINYILNQGPGVRLMKCDIKSAYRLIPICPSDRPLLGFQWGDLYYFDKSLTMGLASACQIFECFSSAIKFILIRYIHNVFIVKILDDFLVITSSQHVCPISAYVTLLAIFKALGIPLAEDKCVPPCRSLTFLGFEIDTVDMCVKLPIDKLIKCNRLIDRVLLRRKVKVRDIQSVCGLLQWACKAIVPGRAFLRRLYDALGIASPYYWRRVTVEMREDLLVWKTFLAYYNGRNIMLSTKLSPHFYLYSDASKSIGYGCVINNKQWFYGVWPNTWQPFSIIVLELCPILLALATWAPLLANKTVHVYTDNLGLVSALNSQSVKDRTLMALIRRVVFLLLHFNILLFAIHISGSKNLLADSLSRGRVNFFQSMCPDADVVPSTIPADWQLSNWTPLSPISYAALLHRGL